MKPEETDIAQSSEDFSIIEYHLVSVKKDIIEIQIEFLNPKLISDNLL